MRTLGFSGKVGKLLIAGSSVLPALASCSSADLGGTEPTASDEQAAWYGADDRVAVTATTFQNFPHLRAIGWLESGGGCTATLVAPATILTAAHCIAKGFPASSILFHPMFVGAPNSPDENTRPSILGLSYFRATADSTKHFGYVPGNDWAIVHLDPATYQQGGPSYPASIFDFPYLPVNYLNFPVPANGQTATHIGYSGDFFTANNAPCRHTGKLRIDGICSTDDFQRSEGPGVLLSDIEREPIASGGPFLVNPFNASSAAIVATVGGGASGGFPTWNQNNANREVSSAGFSFAPYSASGLAFANDTSGKRWTFAADATWINGLRHVAGQNPTYPHYPVTNWYDFRDGGTTPVALVFGRMAATTTTDGHLWAFTIDNTGQVWNKATTSDTTFGNWSKLLSGSGISASAFDVAAASNSGTTIRVSVLHNNCTVDTKRKTGAWNGSWNPTLSLGNAGSGCRGIAASTTGIYQQLFVATSTSVVTRWEVDGGWSGSWSNFADGLPTDVVPVDIAAGLDPQGKMVVALLGRQGSETVIYTRQKSSSVPGSAWNAWTSWVSSANGNAYVELKDAVQVQFAPPTSSTTDPVQSIFFISSGGGMYNAAFMGTTFVNWAPYYAPYVPNPLPGPGVPPCP